MKDCTGNELKIGDRVAFRNIKGITVGTIIRLRIARRYRRELEVAKVRFEVPQKRYGSGRYRRTANGRDYVMDETGNYIWEQGEELTPLLEKEVYGSDNIVLCPKVVKEDLTNS